MLVSLHVLEKLLDSMSFNAVGYDCSSGVVTDPSNYMFNHHK